MKLSFRNILNFGTIRLKGKGKDYVFTQISEEGITLEQARNIKKLHAGATWALDQIVADSPVGEFLKECFPRNKDYKKSPFLSVLFNS